MTKEEQYRKYSELILKWNKSADLTAIEDPEQIKSKHFEDSKAVIPFIDGARNIIDIGCGAGFPGIPIKIEIPKLIVILLDSQRKKINFVRQVIFELGLNGIEAFQGRAEDPDFFRTHGPFDVVISRATWPLDMFLEISEPYYEAGGKCIAMKGPRYQQELKTAEPVIKKYGLILSQIHSYRLRGDEERHLLVFQKS